MEQTTSHILTTLNDGVFTISFNRPDKKNALTLEMYNSLTECLSNADKDPQVRVIVLTAEGDAFTAGNDLYDFMNNPPTDMDSPVIRFLRTLVDMTKPIIAGVNGMAIGVGTTMLLHCDLVYLSEKAFLKLPFVDLGLVPEAASSYIMPRMMGLPKATEYLMLGDRIPAQEAAETGLCTRVFPHDTLMQEVQQRASVLAKKPPSSVRATKDLLHKGWKEEMKRALYEEGELVLEMVRAPEALEAFSAFFEKRKPDFSQFS